MGGDKLRQARGPLQKETRPDMVQRGEVRA